METSEPLIPTKTIDEIYAEVGQWHINVGEEKIHPKRMPGRWRRLKSWSSSVWLVFFVGPYLRWDERQAVLFDLSEKKFHLFGLSLLPQELWILALILLFFAILLAVVTALAGRVFCGFFCFQTVWTDIYVCLEDWLEGPPRQRKSLDQAHWSLAKLRIKATKHLIWLLIGLLTGISFAAWFMDAGQLWRGLVQLTLPFEAWGTIGLFTIGTYSLAGFMREQTCLWLCPYSRIQGVMVDQNTVLPAYDAVRGEPRGRLKKGTIDERLGDCINCNLCVAVCPTGIDIRDGQQSACITCALCIDACDSVMEKIGRPKGLVRYDSLNGLRGIQDVVWFKRPRVWVYLAALLCSMTGITWGLATLDKLELRVVHHRQPMYLLQDDGTTQNGYRLRIFNKSDQPLKARITVSGADELTIQGASQAVTLPPLGVTSRDVLVQLPSQGVEEHRRQIVFHVTTGSDELSASRAAVFFHPSKEQSKGS